VCRTIDKNLHVFNSSIGSEGTNESIEIYKGGLCCKIESEEDKERLKTIKSCLPEPDVIRESEESSETEVHQSLKIGS